MSHFAVAVFTKDGSFQDVESLLARYCEDPDMVSRELLEWVEDEDCEEGGYWCNPDAKWDWYSAGGRWSGLLRVENPEAGILVKDIDFESIEEQRKKELVPFSECFERHRYKPEYFNKLYPTEEAYILAKTRFSTYAVVTPDGEWHAPGEMGWFGMSSDSPEDGAKWRDTYREQFIQPAIENGWYLTIVDCHI